MTLATYNWQGWVYPLPTLGGRPAVISDGFKSVAIDGHRQHLGVDMMYRRLPLEPATLPRGSKGYYMPPNTPVMAAFGGRIWSSNVDGYGHSVQIDHGNIPNLGPTVTFYQHMASFASQWKKGDVVSAGDRLGIVGHSLTGYGLDHLHFELWLPTRSNAVDPAPYMNRWRRQGSPNLLGALSMVFLLGAAGLAYVAFGR
jgi:murein DD-endopeptidase MepM/ murein hydrolase activator NlpD